jgi:predicted nucleotidyltransferase
LSNIIAISNKKLLIDTLRHHRNAIRSFGVSKMGLFGSFLHDELIKPTSDIDLLIDFIPAKKNFDNFIELYFFLEDLTGRKIELVTRESLSPYIGPHILNKVEDVGI